MAEEVMEQVREKIGRKLYALIELPLATEKGIKGIPIWTSLQENIKEEYCKDADQILSIPEILIKDLDQSLPHYYHNLPYLDAQQDMLKENWVKVLPKEEK